MNARVVSGWAWLALVGAVLAGLGVAWLIYPTPIVSGQALVPQLRGIPADQAVADLATVGLRGRIAGEVEDPLTPSGTVAWQVPAAATLLPEGAIVRLGISAGAPRVVVPDMADLDLAMASEILEAAGLRVGRIDSVTSTAPQGAVVRTRPEPRGTIRVGGAVDVFVSRGPRQ